MTIHETDRLLEKLAADQLGRFTRAQVRAQSSTAASLIASRLRSGRWRRLSGRVLCLPGAPMGWLGDVWTARLHVGDDAIVSHRSAARIHGFPAMPRSTPCLTVPAGSNRRYTAGRVYQRSDLPPGQVTRSGGLLVTSPARTLVDLAPGTSRHHLETWFDHLTAERLTTPDEMAVVVQLAARSGKPSLHNLQALLDDYAPGAGPVQGMLERSLGAVIRKAELPPGVAQFKHPASRDRPAFCDRAWLQPRLIVECDGRKWHDRITASRVDKRRDAAAAVEGWQTIRYGYEDLVRNPASIAAELRAIYEQRMLLCLGESAGVDLDPGNVPVVAGGQGTATG